EIGRRESVARSWCEVPAEHEMANGEFVLRGIADRIDSLNGGKVAVIDYKTGNYPSKKVARLLAPQLALEGALVARGAFTGIDPAQPASLYFVRLRPRSAFEAEDISLENKRTVMSAEAISEDDYQRLIAHINAYQDSEQGYLSRYAPALEQEMSGTYDHLARVREWSIGEDADEDSS
ncbi:MAG: PD-(D/E)XK nuclease family protein, partial [Methyloceanibacter sp.]